MAESARNSSSYMRSARFAKNQLEVSEGIPTVLIVRRARFVKAMEASLAILPEYRTNPI